MKGRGLSKILICAAVSAISPYVSAAPYPLFVSTDHGVLGQASLVRLDNRCVAILPKHVFGDGVGIEIVGRDGEKLAHSILYKDPIEDYVVLNVSQSGVNCPIVPDTGYIDQIITGATTQLVTRQLNGNIVPRGYDVKTANGREIAAISIDARVGVSQGMSGGTLSFQGAPIAILTSEREEGGRPIARFLRLDSILSKLMAQGDAGQLTADAFVSYRKPSDAQALQVGGGFAWPSDGRIIGDFGNVASKYPTMMKFAVSNASHIKSAAEGLVDQRIDNKDGSVSIIIRHDQDIYSTYVSCYPSLLQAGDAVQIGQSLFAPDKHSCKASAFVYFGLHDKAGPIDPLSRLGYRSRSTTLSARNASVNIARIDISGLAQRVGLATEETGVLEVDIKALEKAEEQLSRLGPDGVFGQPGDRLPEERLAHLFQVVMPDLRGALEQGMLDVWEIRPSKEAIFSQFISTLRHGGPLTWMALKGPIYNGAVGLSMAQSRYEKILDSGGWGVLSSVSDDADIRKRLLIEEAEGETCEDIPVCIQRAQRRYGLEPSGELGAPTLEALNVPVQRRIEAIIGNLERWKWMPRALDDDRLQINIAAGVATMFEGDAPIYSTRTSSGSKGHPSALFNSVIESIDIWSDVAPQTVAEPIVGDKSWDTGASDEGGALAKSDQLEVSGYSVQHISRIRFNISNSFNLKIIYERDRAPLFAKYDRAISDSDIYIEKGISLAAYLTAKGYVPLGNLAARDGEPIHITLSKPVSVLGLYWTAFAGASGSMSFRADPYLWDARLTESLKTGWKRAISK